MAKKTKTKPAKFMDLVRNWRARRRLSQPAAAAALGVPYRTFQSWEYGVREPNSFVRRLIEQQLRKIK